MAVLIVTCVCACVCVCVCVCVCMCACVHVCACIINRMVFLMLQVTCEFRSSHVPGSSSSRSLNPSLFMKELPLPLISAERSHPIRPHPSSDNETPSGLNSFTSYNQWVVVFAVLCSYIGTMQSERDYSL